MRLVIYFFFFLFNCEAYSQKKACDTVYSIVDEMPVYKKGYKDLINAVNKLKIQDNCNPEELRQIIWTIDNEGNIFKVDVQGWEGTCKDYVIKYAKTLTGWNPGKHNGKPVCVQLVLPIHIRPNNTD